MNISKHSATIRVMCCLMACLVLCFAVMRPITAHATGLEAAAAPVVMANPAVLIPAIIILLGLAVASTDEFQDLCANLVDHISEWFTNVDGTDYIELVQYNDAYYVDSALVQAIQDYLWNGTATADPVIFPMAFSGNTNYKSNIMVWIDNTTLHNYDNIMSFLYSCKWCSCVIAEGNIRSYIWTNTPTSYNSTTKEITIPQPAVATVNFFSGSGVYYDWTAYTGEFVTDVTDLVQNNILGIAADSVTLSTTDGLTVGEAARTLDDEVYSDVMSEAIVIPSTGVVSIPIPITDDEVIATDKTVTISEATSDDTFQASTTGFLSDILSWLKAIWNKLCNIFEGITSIPTKIGAYITDLGADIKEWWDAYSTKINTNIVSLGNSILSYINNVYTGVISIPGEIVDGISGVLSDIFVPAEDYVTTKVEALRARFDWIDPFFVFAENIKGELTGTTPPVIYIHLDDAEGSYNYGGTVKFLDMSWYSRYKPQGDAILSGFLWALFAWRMYLKLPGIIGGVAGDIGQMSYGEPSWQQAKKREKKESRKK